VHWNSAKYSNVDEAMKAEDGLVVLAVFLEVSSFQIIVCLLIQRFKLIYDSPLF